MTGGRPRAATAPAQGVHTVAVQDAPAGTSRPGGRGDGAPGHGYMPGLDGVRALAVSAVLLFHGGVSWAPGGFLGVDVFFVLSGFLITGLLLAEHGRSGRIGLRRFWARRAMRLLPALLLMLAMVAWYAAALAPPDTVSQIRGDALSTLFYVANWHQVLGGQGYLAALQSPSPLVHTWSLAIEEQFYLLWPLVVVAVLRLRRGGGVLLGVAAVGACASAVEMAWLFHSAGQARAYFGTDTRAQDLLVGAVLAIVVARRRAPATGPAHSTGAVAKRSGRLLLAGGLAGLGGLLAAGALTTPAGSWLYEGGFGVVALCSAALIGAVALLPGSILGRAFTPRPIRFLGRISYGLYLWHWPIFLVLDPARTGLTGGSLFALRCGTSLGAATVSYLLVEAPVRRGALGRLGTAISLPAAAAATAVAILVASQASAPSLQGTYQQLEARTLPAASAPAGLSRVPPGIAQATSTNGAVNLLSPVVPSVPAGTGGPIRMLLVGDSEAAFISFGLAPGSLRYGVAEVNDSVLGCGLVGGATLLRDQLANSVVGGRGLTMMIRCSSNLTRWHNDISAYHPDVVALEEGEIDVRTHFLDGRWTYLGQPQFDRVELAAMKGAVADLLAPPGGGGCGPVVVLLTAPYYSQPPQLNGQPWPEDNPARVNEFNRLLRQVAAMHPGRVVVEDLNRRLDPGGRFAATIDGRQMRFSDGVHLSVAGGQWVQPWLLPRIAALGQQNRSSSCRSAAG